MYEFVDLIQVDMIEYPYKKIDRFIRVTKSLEGPGEYWTYKLKKEETNFYQMSFRVTKFDGENSFKFSTFRFDFKMLDSAERDIHFSNIRSIFLKKLGKPRIDNSKKMMAQWMFFEDKDSLYYLMVKNKKHRSKKNKGALQIFLNRISKENR